MDSQTWFPIPRSRNPVYEMRLSIYPVSVCGEDLQTGSPIEVSKKSEDLLSLKHSTRHLILGNVPCSGKCFVEMLITKNGQYYERDEDWFYADIVKEELKTI